MFIGVYSWFAFMKLLFDEDLVEAVVFLCASGRRKGAPSLQIRRFHSSREKLYSILDADERNAAFFQLHLDWFREWQVEEFLRSITGSFSLLDSLSGLAFRKARGKNEEGAELFVNAEQQGNGIVAIRAERFENDDALRRFLNHELMHVSDMVDPMFAYSPDLALTGAARANERLVRERYRLLWDVTIDGRLHQRELATEATRERRWTEFDCAFGFWPEDKRFATFDSLWLGTQPRHSALLALAADPRDLRAVHEPLPGAPCPLCGFSTFEWASASALTPQISEAIRGEFPHWIAVDGACARCAEVYKAVSRLVRSADPYLV
jgi:hypothetical protein